MMGADLDNRVTAVPCPAFSQTRRTQVLTGDNDQTVHTIDSLAGELIETSFVHRTNMSPSCESEYAKAQISSWRAQGFYTMAMSGGFDLLTLNHVRGLVQARLLAASYFLNIKAEENIGQADCERLLEFANSPELKLLVSIDTNQAIAGAKSHNPNKGSVNRPLLDWETRSELISVLAMPPSAGSAYSRMLVDAITAHGDSACLVHDHCLVEEEGYEVFLLQPDVTIMKDVYDAGNKPRHYDAMNIILFSESKSAFFDAVLNSAVSTTNIINKIRGA